MKKSHLKKENENTTVTAEDQVLCTRNMRNVVYGENFQYIYRVCTVADKTVAHIVSECSNLAQKENKQVRHDNVVKMLHWKLCEKWGFNKAEKWYVHKPEKVLESEDSKILWDLPMQTNKTHENNRPDITVIEKKSKKCLLIAHAHLTLALDRRKKKKAQIIVNRSTKLQKFGI